MKGLVFIALVLGWSVFLGAAEAAGWQTAETRRYTRNDLYGYIDGGAELFLETGFEQLTVRHLKKGELTLTLDLYRMESSEAAWAIYLMKCGQEKPLPGVPGRNTGDRYQIMAWKGRHLVMVNNPDGRAEAEADMSVLCRQALEETADEQPAPLLGILDGKGLVPGSERLVRGPYGLQSLFTFGDGDMLRLGGKLFAVAGDYRGPQGEHSAIRVQYPDETAAAAAFTHFCANLDSYLQVVEKSADRIVFRDYRQQFGLAVRRGAMVEILFHLAAAPAATDQ